jgi:hypothetical protein
LQQATKGALSTQAIRVCSERIHCFSPSVGCVDRGAEGGMSWDSLVTGDSFDDVDLCEAVKAMKGPACLTGKMHCLGRHIITC